MIAWGNSLQGDHALDSRLNIDVFTFKYANVQHFIVVYAHYKTA